MKKLQFTLILFLIILNIQSFAVSKHSSNDSLQKALEFTHQTRLVKKYLRVGENVKIRLNNQNKFYRGKIIHITDSTISIKRKSATQVISLSAIELIQKTTVGNIIASIFGGYVALGSTTLAVVGIVDLIRIGCDFSMM
jgi:hypothetical protein